jgi:prolipoprotein diacylglyceryl transferase
MMPVLQVGPLAIQLPGLLLLAGVWLGSSVVEKQGRRLKLPVAALSNLVFIGLVAGLLGARLWYALRFLEVYLDNPLSLLSLNPATLSLPGGVLTGFVAAYGYARRKGLAFWPTLDALTPGLAAFGVAYGFANLASGDAFGAPSELPWAIELWGARRHPSQIYEILFSGLTFAAIGELAYRRPFPGLLFLAWASIASASRLFLEAFRGDSVIVLGTLRLAQLLSLGVLLAAMLAMHRQARRRAS